MVATEVPEGTEILSGAQNVERHAERIEASGPVLSKIPRGARNDGVGAEKSCRGRLPNLKVKTLRPLCSLWLKPNSKKTRAFTAWLLTVLLACATLATGCASTPKPAYQPPPPPSYPPDHRYTLDELIELAEHRNASLDVARYEAAAALGLVDQVKALWLPALRYDFAAIVYDNDINYRAEALNLIKVNVPITGTYNILNVISFGQIVSTGGKRTSGLKQAKMFAAIKKLEVLRQRDAVAFEVANLYHLVCLTNQIDGVLDDTIRRLRVYRQVSAGLNERGSLRATRIDSLQADYFVVQIEQLRIAIRAGRHQAYNALKHYVGVARHEPMILRDATLRPVVSFEGILSRSAELVRGFLARPELKQVDLFTKIRGEQVKFAKAAWAPNIVFLGAYTDISGNGNTILGVVDALILSLLVDVPIYDPARRGRLREALGFEQASLAFQRQIEDLISLEMEVTTVEFQRALATALKSTRARQIAAEHYSASRQAYSRELVPASQVVIAIGLDMLAELQDLLSRFAFQNARAQLKRVTADRASQFGY